MKWNKNEIDIIKRMIRNGNSYEYISIVINKSKNSVKSKLNRLNEKSSDYFKNKEPKCLDCGKELLSETNFCSIVCSASFFNQIGKIKVEKKYTCINCNSIISSRNTYCSQKCDIEHKKKLIYKRIENGDITFHHNTYKKYLIHKFGNKCMNCGWSEIHPITNKVPIQLEHIDGDSNNNNLNNLKLLCPNCHSLTSTYGSLNKGNGRKNRKR